MGDACKHTTRFYEHNPPDVIGLVNTCGYCSELSCRFGFVHVMFGIPKWVTSMRLRDLSERYSWFWYNLVSTSQISLASVGRRGKCKLGTGWCDDCNAVKSSCCLINYSCRLSRFPPSSSQYVAVKFKRNSVKSQRTAIGSSDIFVRRISWCYLRWLWSMRSRIKILWVTVLSFVTVNSQSKKIISYNTSQSLPATTRWLRSPRTLGRDCYVVVAEKRRERG